MWRLRVGLGGSWGGAALGPMPASAARHGQATREIVRIGESCATKATLRSVSAGTMPLSRTAEPQTAGRVRFATAQWSLVLAAAKRDSAEAEEALERLCALYWYPVFAFVRRQARSAEAVWERAADTVSSAEEVDDETRHLMKSARMVTTGILFLHLER